MPGNGTANYTKIPNAILDLMAEMEESELRVVLAVARKTFGWQKDQDTLSMAQLMELTGISKPALRAGVSAAVERGLLERSQDGQSYAYRLLVKPSDRETQFPSSPPPGNSVSYHRETEFPTQLGNSVSPQKKDLKVLKEINDDGTRDAADAALKSLGLEAEQRRKILEARPTITLDEIATWVPWLATPPDWVDRPVGKCYTNLLRGDPVPPERAPKSRNGRNGPAQSDAPEYDIEEAKRRGAAHKAKLMEGLPEWA